LKKTSKHQTNFKDWLLRRPIHRMILGSYEGQQEICSTYNKKSSPLTF